MARWDEDEDGAVEEEDEEIAAARPAGTARVSTVYNTEAMHEKLEDIGWPESIDWLEHMSLTSSEPTVVDNVDDDLSRELAFYNQALESTLSAISILEQRGVPWARPPDYYAEMVKSDEHMSKVKEQFMQEQKRIEEMEERRKQRELKYYSKQVQAEKQKDRAQDKKRQIEQISKLRKQRKNTGTPLDMDKELDRMERSTKLGDRISAGGPAKGKKRQWRDAKFGAGGRKRLKKQNDASSAADMEGYRQGRFQDQYQSKSSGKKGKGHAKRPGKDKRMAARGKKMKR